jgi:hypothetical protein
MRTLYLAIIGLAIGALTMYIAITYFGLQLPPLTHLSDSTSQITGILTHVGTFINENKALITLIAVPCVSITTYIMNELYKRNVAQKEMEKAEAIAAANSYSTQLGTKYATLHDAYNKAEGTITAQKETIHTLSNLPTLVETQAQQIQSLTQQRNQLAELVPNHDDIQDIKRLIEQASKVK